MQLISLRIKRIILSSQFIIVKSINHTCETQTGTHTNKATYPLCGIWFREVVVTGKVYFLNALKLHNNVVGFGEANICCNLKILSVQIRNVILKPKRTNKCPPHTHTNERKHHHRPQKQGRKEESKQERERKRLLSTASHRLNPIGTVGKQTAVVRAAGCPPGI